MRLQEIMEKNGVVCHVENIGGHRTIDCTTLVNWVRGSAENRDALETMMETCGDVAIADAIREALSQDFASLWRD